MGSTREFTAFTVQRLYDTAELLSDPGASMRSEMAAAELQADVLRNERNERPLTPDERTKSA